MAEGGYVPGLLSEYIPASLLLCGIPWDATWVASVASHLLWNRTARQTEVITVHSRAQYETVTYEGENFIVALTVISKFVSNSATQVLVIFFINFLIHQVSLEII